MILWPRGARQVAGENAARASAVRALLAAGAVMGAGVAVCLVVAPRPVVVADGFSWFGVTRATLVPYAVAMLGTSALLLRAALELAPIPDMRPLALALAGCAVLLPLLVATPFTLSTVVEDAHEAIGSALFVVQLLAVDWLRRRTRDRLVGVLLVVQFGAGVVCAASLPDLVPGMLQAQLVFQAAFTAATVRGLILLGGGAAAEQRQESARRSCTT